MHIWLQAGALDVHTRLPGIVEGKPGLSQEEAFGRMGLCMQGLAAALFAE